MPAADKAENFKRFVREYIKKQWVIKRRPLTFDQGQEEYLSRAKLFFYEKGTVRPLETFSDQAMKHPQKHPITPDRAGDFPRVFIKATTGYKVSVTNRIGIEMFTYHVEPENTFPMIH
jgi:hypothetical protein